MPITDLTWQQVQTALGTAGAITVTDSKVVINVQTLNGDTLDALTDMGVMKFLNKFLDACLEAQTTANTGQEEGERLNAFSLPTYGNPANGSALITRTVRFSAQLESATLISGPTI